jgi:ATP-binding protein involved in chromosome partitioning
VIDPRASVVEKRLSGVKRIAAFCSAKGGVGKTACACLSALIAARSGMRAGILDLDFQGASAHLVLGVEPRFPEEKEGIIPLSAPCGVSLMTAAAFTRERALPLRGPEVSNAILELFAVTVWGGLDLLCIDMPPGIGDEVLDLIGLLPRLEAVVISTPSAVSVRVVERMLDVLVGARLRVDGVVCNMARGGSDPVAEMAARKGVPYAGKVPYDAAVEEATGNPDALLRSRAAAGLEDSLAMMGLIPR